MRAVHAIQLAMFGALLSGCAGARNVLPPIGPLPAAGGTETPLSSSVFGNSVGINLHMIYGTTPYDKDFAKWSPILLSSGIRHVRDGVCPTVFSVVDCITRVPQQMNVLADNGVKFDLVTTLNDPFAYVPHYIQTYGLTPVVEAYEGPNECDTGRYCPSNWVSTEEAYQQQVYTLKSPSVDIIAPSMTTVGGYAALGSLSAYVDFGNIHDYPGAAPPESVTATPTMLQWAAAMSGNEPVWSTEDGYSTDTNSKNGGISPVVEARYLPRMLLEHLRLGVMRTYIYQLFDYGSDGGAHMGLLSADYTPKPAWTTLRQLMQLFADNGPASRTPLSFSMTGDTSGTLDHVLFQRSDGLYMLAFWLAEASYDPSSGAVLPNNSELIKVSLPPTVATATLTAFGDNGVQPAATLAGGNGVFQVPVRTTVSVLEFHT